MSNERGHPRFDQVFSAEDKLAFYRPRCNNPDLSEDQQKYARAKVEALERGIDIRSKILKAKLNLKPANHGFKGKGNQNGQG